MGRRILNRRELRDDFEAAERQKTTEDDVEEEEDEDEDEDEEGEGEAEGEADAEADEEGGAGDDEEDEEEAPKKKRKAPAKVAKPKAKPKSRSRSAKVTRMKVVWGVFNNSNQRVAVYDYPKRKEADEKAAQLTADKKSTHFVQPVKEAIEEKKDS
jgi:hypothetical protein